jgi:hypothetical protein
MLQLESLANFKHQDGVQFENRSLMSHVIEIVKI